LKGKVKSTMGRERGHQIADSKKKHNGGRRKRKGLISPDLKG